MLKKEKQLRLTSINRLIATVKKRIRWTQNLAL